MLVVLEVGIFAHKHTVPSCFLKQNVQRVFKEFSVFSSSSFYFILFCVWTKIEFKASRVVVAHHGCECDGFPMVSYTCTYTCENDMSGLYVCMCWFLYVCEIDLKNFLLLLLFLLVWYVVYRSPHKKKIPKKFRSNCKFSLANFKTFINRKFLLKENWSFFN